jgi:sec-independent protein translocase protein TatB
MFDISFSELMVIGVIALIVLGPERMPKIARTVGHLLGRAQRYVNEVKSDIQKEMDLKEIGDIKTQMEDAARSVQSSMAESAQEFKSAVDAPAQALKADLDEARKALDTGAADPVAPSAPTSTAAAPLPEPATPLAAAPVTPPETAAIPAQPPAAAPAPEPAPTESSPRTPA